MIKSFLITGFLASIFLGIRVCQAHESMIESSYDTKEQAEYAATVIGCQGVYKLQGRWYACRSIKSRKVEQHTH